MGFFGNDKLESMDALLLSQVKDLYDAESRIVSSMPDMIEKASCQKLKAALTSHMTESAEHVTRLEEIFSLLNEDSKRETCKATKGLLDEAAETISTDGDPDVLDAALIAAAQRIEHYEISAYGSAKAFAEKCGQDQVARLLGQTLAEEHNADKILSHLASTSINNKAAAANLSS